MKITILDTADQPLYRQIYDQLAADILTGALPPDSALPPIRTVATQLKISVISVKRAWEELSRDGYITTAVGRGSFVAAMTEAQRQEKRQALLSAKLSGGVDASLALGAAPEEIMQAVQGLLNRRNSRETE